MLFLGDGMYMGGPDPAMERFIRTLDGSKVKNAAVFGTYGGQKKAIVKMKELLKEQGINVVEESFGCPGKCWLVLNLGHPGAQDLVAAKEFAKRTLGKIK
jgi:flavorubredoxin